MKKQDLIKAGAKQIGEMDFKDPLYQDAYGGTKTYWYWNGDVYESTYNANRLTYTGMDNTLYIGRLGDLYEQEMQRNNELLPEYRDDRFLNLLQEFVIKDAANTEISTYSHDDYPEDYMDYKEFALSNVQLDSYQQYLIDTYDLPKSEAADLQNAVVTEIERQFEEKIMDIYAVWGVAGHEKTPIFTAIKPDPEDAYDKLTVRIPKHFAKYETVYGEICIENKETGVKYSPKELLSRQGTAPVFRWNDGEKTTWRMLKVLDGSEKYRAKTQKQDASDMKKSDLNHPSVRSI